MSSKNAGLEDLSKQIQILELTDQAKLDETLEIIEKLEKGESLVPEDQISFFLWQFFSF